MLARGASRSVRVALNSTGWPSAEAKIETSEVSSRTSKGSITYQVFATYRFYVGDRDFTGSIIHPGYEGSSDEASTRALAQKLAPGTHVEVRYDPTSPGSSTIVPGYVASAIIPLVGGFMFIAVGCGFLVIVTLGLYFKIDLSSLVNVLKNG